MPSPSGHAATFHQLLKSANPGDTRASAGTTPAQRKQSDPRGSGSRRIGAFDLFDGNYTDVLDSCGTIDRGSLTSSSGAALWSSTEDICAFGTFVDLPKGVTEWRITFEEIDECEGNLWAFTVANPDFDVVEKSSTVAFPSNDCGDPETLTTKWTDHVYNNRAYFTIFTDAFIGGLYFNSVFIEYKTSGTGPNPKPTQPGSISVACAASPVNGKPGIICAGSVAKLDVGTRLAVNVRAGSAAKWSKLASGHQPTVAKDGTFYWAMSAGRAASISVIFVSGDVKSNTVTVSF